MYAIVQRVNQAKVIVDGEEKSRIGAGLAVLIGIESSDTQDNAAALAQKISTLRIFEDERGKMFYSVKDKSLEVLAISNFTLCADTSKGRRPSFEKAMKKEQADELFKDLTLLLSARGIEVRQGSFGDHMNIHLELDGPVTIALKA